MAVLFDANTDALYRTTNLPSTTTVSASWWLYRVEDTNAFGDLLIFRDTNYTAWMGVYMNTDGTQLHWDDTTGVANGSQTTANTWYHCALSKDSGSVTVYLNGQADITRSGAPNPTINGISMGDIGGFGTGLSNERFGGRIAAMKVWSGAALTQAELEIEGRYILPVRTANLQTFLPCIHPVAASNNVDFSGNGFNMTVGGTLTVQDGPPIPWGFGQRTWQRVAGAPAIGAPEFLAAARLLTRTGGIIGHVVR